MSEQFLNFINGQWEPSVSGETFENYNPADITDIIGSFPNSSEDDAISAVTAAAAAQAAWGSLSSHARGEYLRKAADVMESRADEIARGLMREEGKSLPEAKGETGRAIVILRYYGMQGMLPDGDVIPSAGATTFLYSRRIPLGVVSLITPWNFPVAIPIWKAAPALLYGNTVVLKPSELSPLTAVRIAECFEAAGLPKGVFNVIHGYGARTGQVLSSHSSVSAVSFTGSVTTGKKIAASASAAGKKYQLEMGGKNASVVMPDASFDQAVNLTIQGAFKSAGEKCTATSRAIIHTDLYDKFATAIVERTAALSIGEGSGPAYLGPVISTGARDRILGSIDAGVRSGAKLLCGGKAPDQEELRNGCYILPTIFGDVEPDSVLAQEEIFGPVLCLMRANDFEHAIELLNGVEFGLSASLFTSDLGSAMKFAEKAQAGMIRINGETAGVEPQAPFGGVKASSSWSREQGLAARDFFTQIKTVSIDLPA